MAVQKTLFRTKVKDYVERRAGKPLGELNDFQKSQMLTRGYLELVLRKLNPGLVPDDDEDFEDCFCDGPSDAGVDFLYRSDGHVLLIQSKYRGEGKAEDEKELDHFIGALTRLHPIAGKNFKLSNRVRELAGEIDWDNDSFDLQFVTLGKAGQNLRARTEIGQSPVVFAKGLEDRVEIALLDETDLNEKIREAESAGEHLQDVIELRFRSLGDSPRWLEYQSEGGRVSYLGYVEAAQLRNLYSRHKYRLFAQNIRNYVGDTSTNKGIIQTALDEPDNFVFFNNGLAAISTKITPSKAGDYLMCERFSVINGAQTVRSLAKAHVRDSRRAASAVVLVRVSEVSFKRSEPEEAFLDKITRFNNTQNAVKLSDFRSNDPIQRALAAKFKELGRGGKQYWYKNKRSGDRNPRTIPIGMEEFAKTLYAFRFGPADMFGGSAHLFSTSADGGYVKLFGEKGEVLAVLPDRTFAEWAGTYFLCEAVRDGLAEEKQRFLEDQEADKERLGLVRKALERRWLVYFAVGELLRQRYVISQKSLEDDLVRLGKPKWLDSSPKLVETISRYTRVAAEFVMKSYRSAAKSEGFVHRNWFRTEETLRDLREEIRYSSTVLESLDTLHPD